MTTENKSTEKTVKEYLKKIEEALPFWLKEDKEQKEEIIEELENHLWDKATELANGAEPSVFHVQEAITQMGTAKSIAQEYKRRGTPKWYISEELFPYYTQGLAIGAAIVVFFNVLAMIVALINSEKSAWAVIGQTFSGIWTSFLIAGVVITITAVSLSMQGFLPEDFERLAKKDKKTKAKEGKPIKESKKAKEIKEPKTVNYGTRYLGDAIMGLIFGALLIFLPFYNLFDYITLELDLWLRFLGGLILLQGIIRFGQVMAGNKIRAHQIFKMVHTVPQGLGIVLLVQVKTNKAIIINTLLDLFPGADIELYVTIFMWVGIVGTIIGMLTEVIQSILLETRGIPLKGK